MNMPLPDAALELAPRKGRTSAARKESAREARATAISDLSQAKDDLAEERTKCLELEMRLQSSEKVIASLHLDNSNLSEELKLLRAADIPNLLYSISLVVQLHALVVCSPSTDMADTRQPKSSSPASLQRDGEASRTSLFLDWEGSPPHRDTHRLAALETSECPTACSSDTAWPLSTSWSPSQDTP